MIPILAVVIASLLVGLLGARRRLGFWGGFFACFVVTPAGGLLLVLVSGKLEPTEAPS